MKFTKQNNLPRGYSKHRLYNTWRMMNIRCYNPNYESYKKYGGRGITVCDEWRYDNNLGLFNFLEDMWKSFQENTTLDRIDNNLGYFKTNCRWAIKRVQQNNTGMFETNTSGIMGVQIDGNYLHVTISMNNKPVTIGRFKKGQEKEAEERYNLVKSMKLTHTDEQILNFINSIDRFTPKKKRFYGRKTSIYYGVSWSKSKSKWRTAVPYRDEDGNLKQKFLGYFCNEKDAWESVKNYLELRNEL